MKRHTPVAGTDLGLFRVNLSDFSVEVWAVPKIGKQHLLVAGLVNSGGAKGGVHAIVGIPRRDAENATVVSYFLARITWRTKAVAKIRRMSRIWC
jgi:hypothetical protein